MVAAAFAKELIDPGPSFAQPSDGVSRPGLRDEQKRVILRAWANDALGLEWADARDLTEFAPATRLDALVEALEHFDPTAAAD